MQKKQKPAKALEKCAREVKDADELVAHVTNIAARYRREHKLDLGMRNVAVRKSLRAFQKHAVVVAAWLQQAQRAKQSRKSSDASAEATALGKIGAVMYGVPSMAYAESKNIATWLTQAEQAAARCLTDAKILPRKPQADAVRIAAEALRATFEYHKLKWSAKVTKQEQSDAVRLLCAIAKSAGDATLTPEIARSVLRQIDGKAA
jgi:hypothetical protein